MIDSIIRVASPDGVAFDLHPAGPPARMAAFLLDSLFQMIIASVGLVILAIFKITGSWTQTLIAFIITWFYMVAFELICAGRSPGKMILGLQTVLNDGSPINLGASLLRNLLRPVDYLFGIGLLVPFFNQGFRRLGDFVGGTMVVYVPKRLMRNRGKLDLAGIEARPPEHILSPEAADVLLSFARRRAGFSAGLREELAQAAAKVYLLENPVTDAEPAVLAVAAWYAGFRPGRKDAHP